MKTYYLLPTADHLFEDEVDYELMLRKMRPDKRESLEDKRRLLRRLVNEDRKHKSSYPPIMNIMEDNEQIEQKIAELDESLSEKLDRASVSRLRHYLNRAAKAAVTDSAGRKVQEELCERIQEIFRKHKVEIMNTDCESEDQDKSKDKEEQEKEERQRKEQLSKGARKKELDERGAKWAEEKKINEEGEKLKNQKEDHRDRKERYKDKQEFSDHRDESRQRHGREEDKKRSHRRQSRKRDNYREEEDSSSSRGYERHHRSKLERERYSDDTRRHRQASRDRTGKRDLRKEERYSEDEEGKYGKHKEKRKHRDKKDKEKRLSHEQDEKRKSSERTERHRSPRRGKEEKRRSTRRRSRSTSRSDSETSVKSGNRFRRGDGSSSDTRSSGSDSEYERGRHRRPRGRRGRRHRRRSSSSRSPSLDRSHYRRSRVQNWDLNFSGDNRSIQVEDFLSRIKKLARHEGVSAMELLMNIHHRLKGEAYDWWFTREDRFTRWEKFEHEIRFRYGNPNRDRGIRAQIRELKQKRGESFIAYVTEMEKLNQCLQRRFSSRTLFELIWENMRPHYRSRLSVLHIKGLEHLIEVNHKIDANDPSLYRTGQGSRPEIHHLEAEDESDDVYSEENEAQVYTIQNRQQKSGNKPQQQLERKSLQQPRSNPQHQIPNTQQQPQLQTPRFKCWNCLKEGHIWRACNEPKRVFCYACGNMGRTTRNCENNHPGLTPQSQSHPTN